MVKTHLDSANPPWALKIDSSQPGMLFQAYSYSTWEEEAKNHHSFKVNLDYIIRPYLKICTYIIHVSTTYYGIVNVTNQKFQPSYVLASQRVWL